MLGVLAGMAIIGRAVLLDFFEREPDRSLFLVGRHSRDALAILGPWRRRLFFTWLGALIIGLTWILVHALFEVRT
jgi:hypothetical protein